MELHGGSSCRPEAGDALAKFPDEKRVSLLRRRGLACLLALAFWPSVSASAAPVDLRLAKEKFKQLCAVCHGPSGRGDGPAAAALNPKPRNYSDKAFASRITDAAMFEIIKRGGAAVQKSPAMPAWGEALSEDEVRSLVAYIRTLMPPREK